MPKGFNRGIYVGVDYDTGKVYLGATEDKPARFQNHRADLRNNRHHNKPLQEAYNQNHEFKVTFIPVQDDVNPFDLETQLINEFKPTAILYNQARGMGQRKHSAESIEKMRQAKLGKKTSEETKQKQSAALMGKNVGKVRTPEMIEAARDTWLKQARRVMVDGVEYESVGAASRAHDIDVGTASSRCSGPRFTNWVYLDDRPKKDNDNE